MNIKSLRDFKNLSYVEKVEVISNGRPTPELKELKQAKGKSTIRTFNAKAWYSKKEWLCGCSETNKLFCFPCLLFSINEGLWTKTGYNNLNNLTNALNKHERSISHFQSQVSLKTFGSDSIDLSLNAHCIELHNKKVKENHDILKMLIDTACFLIKQELPFYDESQSSLNQGNYIELLNFVAKKDEQLAQHLGSSSVFLGTSSKIQNDLIKAIVTSVENNIKEEIMTAHFIALEIDEVTDISNKANCSTVLRYVVGPEVKEAFIGFDELCDRTANVVIEKIFQNLDKYSCTQKLVAQTYNGGLVMTSHLNGIQAKIKEKVPSALFTHCYAHKLNLILFQSAKFIPECTRFFKTIEGLTSFFNYSAKRAQLIDQIVKKRIPKVAPTRWSTNSKRVQTILHCYSDLCKLFNDIKNCPTSWDADTVVKSSGFLQWLNNGSTYFLLIVYDKIFSKTDILFNILQFKMIDIHFCIECINETLDSFENMTGDFENIYRQFEESCVENNLTFSNHTKCSSKAKKALLFHSVLYDVIKNIEIRYKDFKNLEFISLVDNKKFKEYCSENKVCKNALISLEKNYGNAFDIIRLKSELIAIYNMHVFYDKNIKNMLHYIFQNELQETFFETVKLLQLVLTIPTTIVSVERSFSALKRIKKFTRNRITSKRHPELALASIEKERIIQMEKDKSFHKNVSEIFIYSDEGRSDFIYK